MLDDRRCADCRLAHRPARYADVVKRRSEFPQHRMHDRRRKGELPIDQQPLELWHCREHRADIADLPVIAVTVEQPFHVAERQPRQRRQVAPHSAATAADKS